MRRGLRKICEHFYKDKSQINCVRNIYGNNNVIKNNFLLCIQGRNFSNNVTNEKNEHGNGNPYTNGMTSAYYWAESTKNKIHDSKINELREQFSILKDYDDSDLMIWRTSFNQMDKDKDNFISHADLQKSDWSLEKYTLFQNYDMDKNNLIDFGEYIQAIIDIDTQHFKNFFQGFRKIDIELEFQKYAITEKDNNKKIIPLTKLMQMLKDKEFTCVTETDSRKLFNLMDMNQDGYLDFEDFVKVQKKKKKIHTLCSI
ncbi:EF-hand calcium-binding domain-containing protein [Plasmodium yoelii yoelii]|uniref:non-specific serine/threonine protein kinase n=1 Tax=Plasmodium yoelii yoelii TaxID=73239 RepID=A0AAE9WQ24_PLAYO|nr:EF-hand calcium-binding domain-containing protein [Plasmodium yoelii yoelii]